MTEDFRPNMMTTGIGSLPLTDADEAVDLVLNANVSIPFWPQLPKRYFLEQMIRGHSRASAAGRAFALLGRLGPGDRLLGAASPKAPSRQGRR